MGDGLEIRRKDESIDSRDLAELHRKGAQHREDLDQKNRERFDQIRQKIEEMRSVKEEMRQKSKKIALEDLRSRVKYCREEFDANTYLIELPDHSQFKVEDLKEDFNQEKPEIIGELLHAAISHDDKVLPIVTSRLYLKDKIDRNTASRYLESSQIDRLDKGKEEKLNAGL